MYNIIHNGYKILYGQNDEEVDEYIKSVLAPNMGLNPQKIMDRRIDKNTRLIRYRYRTLYEEDFIVEVAKY